MNLFFVCVILNVSIKYDGGVMDLKQCQCCGAHNKNTTVTWLDKLTIYKNKLVKYYNCNVCNTTSVHIVVRQNHKGQ